MLVRTLQPAGFITPCLPTLAKVVPSGPEWAHEVKHDGYRMICRRDGDRVRVFSRNAREWTDKLPAIVAAMQRLRATSITVDGEAVVCDDHGVTDFDALFAAIARRGGSAEAFLYAFDLLELDGQDLRHEPWEVRRETLASLLRRTKHAGLRLSEHLDGDGDAIFRHACAMGLEGIVSKRRDAPYRSGRSPHWVKVKNPDSPAAKRIAEIEW
jgi:bifunctional non-homologous end joining protein LigD